MRPTPQVSSRLFKILLILLSVMWVGSVALMAAENPQNQSPGPTIQTAGPEGLIIPKTNHPKQSGDFVGNETCLTCHEGQDKGLGKTLHGNSAIPGTPASNGDRKCESCHGPGKAHVDSGDKKDIKSFKTLSAKDANETCMSCHTNRTSHVDWDSSMHNARNVSCVSCHSAHSPKSESFQLKTVRASETCASCHTDKALKNRKSSHMPLHEGKMECTSCHSPHGSKGEKMLKVGFTVNESCVSCHTEKRGPFLWEHAPVENSCVTCHEPHGTNNVNLLKQKVPFMCQTCHVNTRHPPTIYDQTQVNNASNRILGNACVNCHNQLHGSNHPAGNRFLR